GIFFLLIKGLPERGRIFSAASAWFFLEIIVAHFLTGFPWLPLGLSQYSSRWLLPVVSLVTVFGLSSLLMMFNLLLATGWTRHHLVSWSVIIPLTAALVFGGRAVNIEGTPAGWLRVLLLQENIASYNRLPPAEIFQSHYRTTITLLKEEPADLVVWPESSFPDILDDHPELMTQLRDLSQRHHCALLLGGIGRQGQSLFNTAYLFSGENLQVYRKRHLVPYGEFILGGRYRLLRKIYSKLAGYQPQLQPGQEYTLFHFPVSSRREQARVNVLICFENIFPEISAEFVTRGSQACLVITNDSWFLQSPGPYQHFAHNILRATETGRYFAQTAITGITGVVSPEKGVSALIESDRRLLFVRGHLRYTLPLLTGETPAGRCGYIPVLLLLLTVSGGILCRTRKG
ncbi:MAG TPA: apolipoprotein N-acyltransferase, partial [bacterium]|nr:apolipoprotein N-acyltransferase [bacterium]